MKKLLFGALLVTFVAATPARAQDEKLMHVNIGGGFTVPVSSIGDEFSTGGAFNIGLSIDPSPMFGFQVEYSYNDLSGQDRQVLLSATPILADITNGVISSHHTMHYIDFNGTVRPKGTSLIKPYGVGGVGAYYRSVSLTTPDVGFTTICDPYWYVCYPTAVSVDRIIGDRHSWDPGINLGGGVTVAIGESAQFYVETRWHYVWGPSTTNPVTNETLKANAQYFPVTFGFRF